MVVAGASAGVLLPARHVYQLQLIQPGCHRRRQDCGRCGAATLGQVS